MKSKRLFGGFKTLELKKAYNKKYYQKYREESLLYQRQYRLDNLEKVKETDKNYRLKHRIMRDYGISNQDYLNMLNNQNYKCAICNVDQSSLSRKLNIDHCHKTGKVRGLLCNTCNRALGYFHDSIYNLKKAMEYLNVNC